MSTAVAYSNFQTAPIQPTPFQELLSNQFERVFAIINAFAGDHHKAVLHTESVFRLLEEERDATARQLYQLVGKLVRMLPRSQMLPAGLSSDDALCLLFKELCGYGYADISALLSLDAEDVKFGISRARQALLAA